MKTPREIQMEIRASKERDINTSIHMLFDKMIKSRQSTVSFSNHRKSCANAACLFIPTDIITAVIGELQDFDWIVDAHNVDSGMEHFIYTIKENK